MFGRLLFFFLVAVASLTAGAPAQAESDCYGPRWSRFNEPTLGLSLEASTDIYRNYSISDEGFLVVSVGERARPGDKIAGRCSSMMVSVTDFSPQRIANKAGLLAAERARVLRSSLEGQKILSDRSLTIQGHPARELTYSFITPFFGGTASHRLLMIARDNQLIFFQFTWGDGQALPDDGQRIIQFTAFDSLCARSPRGLPRNAGVDDHGLLSLSQIPEAHLFLARLEGDRR